MDRLTEKDGQHSVAGPSHASSKEFRGGSNRMLLNTVGKHGVVVLPGDINENGEINPCVYGPETHEKPTFDYVECMELNRLQALLYQVRRMKDAMQNPIKVYKVNHPGDEYLKRLLESRYGSVDLDAPETESILQTVKESMMEQEEVDPNNDPEIQSQLLEEGIEFRNPILAEEQLMTMIQDKFGGKMEFLQTFNPREASGDWFILPRGDPKLVRLRNFEQVPHPSKAYAIERVVERTGINGRHKEFVLEYHEPQAPEDVKPPLSNLHLYDPKFEFSFVPPYRIFTKEPDYEYEDEDENLGIPRIMSKNILLYLNNFPFGISPTSFLEKIEENKKGRVFVKNMKPSKVLRSHHSSEIWFAKDVVPGLPELMLPGFLKNVVNLDMVLKRIWHAINCIVGMKSFVTVDHLLWLIEQIYSLKFDPEVWNFKNMQSFITFCNKKFGASALAVHRLVTRMGDKNVYLEYVLIDSKYWRHRIEEIHGVGGPANLMSLQPNPYPMSYLHRGDDIDAYSNHLSENDGIEGLVEWMTDPFNMFLVQQSHLDERNDFSRKIQSNSLLLQSQSWAPPAANAVDVGMYMLAYTSFKEYQRAKYFRVLVVRKLNEFGSLYQVYAIDYGYIGDVAVKCLRYMPRGEDFERPAYAIPVQINFSPTTKLMKQRFKDCKITLGAICKDHVGHYLSVKLEKARLLRKFGCCKWTITCHIKKLTRGRDPYVIEYPDVATKINNVYVKLERKKQKEREKATSLEII